ncbi:MAG: transposase [Planctomycetota bacterium]
MPRSYRIFSEDRYAYFVTCSVVNWLPLFVQESYRRIILDSLAYIREHKGTELNAFVVMPTHFHAVLWPQEGVNLSNVLRDLKRHTSRSISREAGRRGDHEYLHVFASARHGSRARDVSQYQVWQEGSHPEAIFSDDFARQKIEYIHNNLVKAELAGKPEDWLYSSARAYLSGQQTHPPTDILSLW